MLKLKTILAVAITVAILLLIGGPKAVGGEATTVPTAIASSTPATSTPPTVQELVKKYATKYNVSSVRMMETIRCENRDLNPKLQSGMRYKFSDPKRGIRIGDRERSFGLVQIHLPDHPEITYEQATNAEFSIEFMAKKFAQGRQGEWYCY